MTDIPNKIDKSFKFQVTAHMRHMMCNIPEDAVYRHPVHEDAKCLLNNCTCICPDCVIARNEDAGQEPMREGEIDYEQVVNMIIKEHNAGRAKRVR